MKGYQKALLIVGIIIAVLIILIATPLIMFSKNYKVPVEQYSTEEAYFMKHFDDEYLALVNDTSKETINVDLTEIYINQFIKREITKDNHKYMNETYKGELEYKYMYVSGGSFKAGIKGLYTIIKEDQIDIILSVDLLSGKTRLYQTGVLIKVDIELNEEGTYILKVVKINLGRTKLSLKKGLGFASYLTDKINGKKLDEVINDSLPFGYYNKENYSLEIKESDIIAYAKEKHEGLDVFLKLIYDNDLIALDVNENKINLKIEANKLRKPSTAPSKPNFTPLTTPREQVAFVTGLNTRLLAGFISNPTNPSVDLNEIEANQVLNYSLKDKVEFSKEFPIKLSETEKVNYYIESSNLFLKMQNNELSIYVEFVIRREGEVKTFDIQLRMNSTIAMVDEDILITMIDGTISNINLTSEDLIELVKVYSEGMVRDGKIVITKEQLNEMFNGAEMVIKNVSVVNGKLRIYYLYTGN